MRWRLHKSSGLGYTMRADTPPRGDGDIATPATPPTATTAIPADAAVLLIDQIAVLLRVVDGLSSKEIAYGMAVSVRTVETQRAKIMKKLAAESIPQLVRKVLRHSTAK